MNISDIKRISKDWNAVWQSILAYHRFSFEELDSYFMKDFLLELTIDDVIYRNNYTEDCGDEGYYFSEATKFRIFISFQGKIYELLYSTYWNSYDAYDPDYFIIEHQGKKTIKKTIYDFFESYGKRATTNVFYECTHQLFKEIDHEYNSELRIWEIEQYQKENHRMYAKNKYNKRKH